MGSLDRLLSLLGLFTPAAPIWTAEELIRHTGQSRANCYRYIRALHKAGLIAPVASGQYILGPRILELDCQIRQCDPLYNAGGETLKRLAESTGHSALMCALYSDSVVCVREERTPDSPEALFSRGQKRPLFRGAASKVILPFLPPHQLRSLYARNRKEIALAGLGADLDAFRAALRRIRRDGYCVTIGEFNPGVVGISAPIFNRGGAPLGSIGIALAQSRLKRGDLERLAPRVVAAGQEVTERIGSLGIGLDLPARAVG